MNNYRMPNQNYRRRERKRERPWKRWTDEFEKELNIMRTRNLCTVTREWKEWKKTVLEDRVHNGTTKSGRRRRRKRRRRRRRRRNKDCRNSGEYFT